MLKSVSVLHPFLKCTKIKRTDSLSLLFCGCWRTLYNQSDRPSSIAGRVPPAKVPGIKKRYGSTIWRFKAAFDSKFGHWKILQPFYDRIDPIETSDLRLLYKDKTVTRAQLSRGIWVGYATAAIIAAGITMDVKGVGTECVANPLMCLGCIGLALSFSGYAALTARSYVYRIHEREIEVSSPKRHQLNRLAKASNCSYVITCANPVTGSAQQVPFQLKDVYALDQKTMDSWPWWKKLLYYIDPAKPNIRVAGRWFLVHAESFINGQFHEALVRSGNNEKVRRRRP